MQEIIKEIITQEIYKIVISIPKSKQQEYYKIIIRPITLKEKDFFQIESLTKTQAFHLNIPKDDIKQILNQYFVEYKQFVISTEQYLYNIRISKKDKLFVSKTSHNIQKPALTHNRQKQYLLEGQEIPILIDLGIVDNNGQVIPRKSSKYKQINRFIEIVEDVLKEKEYQALNIVDFGCGKAYLTFVLYHYLKNIKNINVKIVGIDLKKQIIDKCNQLANKYNYDQLYFHQGDVKTYQSTEQVDMVVSLHACDIASDYALYQAIQLNAKIILCAPCCQSEINQQFKPKEISLFNEYGLIQERISSLITDGLRANILGVMDYQVSILEFIESKHSPKNIMLRAVKRKRSDKNKLKQQVYKIVEEFQLEPTLLNLLKKDIK